MTCLKVFCGFILGIPGLLAAYYNYHPGSRPIAYQLPTGLLRPALTISLQASDSLTINHGLQATLVNQTDSPLSIWHPDEPWGCASLFFVIRKNFIQPLDTLRPRLCIDWDYQYNTPIVARLEPRQGQVYTRNLLNRVYGTFSINRWSIGDLFLSKDTLRLEIKAVLQNGPMTNNAPFYPETYFEYKTLGSAYWRREIPDDFWRGTIESPWIYLLALPDSTQTDPCMALKPSTDCRNFKPIGFMDAADWRDLRALLKRTHEKRAPFRHP